MGLLGHGPFSGPSECKMTGLSNIGTVGCFFVVLLLLALFGHLSKVNIPMYIGASWRVRTCFADNATTYKQPVRIARYVRSK